MARTTRKASAGIADGAPDKPESKAARCFLIGGLVNDIHHELAEAKEKAARHGIDEAAPNIAVAEARLAQLAARLPSVGAPARDALAALSGVRARKAGGSPRLSGPDAARAIEAAEAKAKELVSKAQRFCAR